MKSRECFKNINDFRLRQCRSFIQWGNLWLCPMFVSAEVFRIAIKPLGGGVLPYKRLMGMCCWMWSHFHDWIDCNGVTFLVVLLEWGHTFSGFLG